MKPKPESTDPWAAFDGIPLMHVPRTPEEAAELERKGTCRCSA